MVYIFNKDALDRMAAVEGEDWLQGQIERWNRPLPSDFHTFKKAWEEEEWEDDEIVENENGDRSIYGDLGISRYIVRGNGEIILTSWSTRKAKQKVAKKFGFRID